MTSPTWPQIIAASASLRTVGCVYGHVADALEYDHRILDTTRNTEPNKSRNNETK